eukprot:6949593-Pyramimonas_sp.AAC.2
MCLTKQSCCARRGTIRTMSKTYYMHVFCVQRPRPGKRCKTACTSNTALAMLRLVPNPPQGRHVRIPFRSVGWAGVCWRPQLGHLKPFPDTVSTRHLANWDRQRTRTVQITFHALRTTELRCDASYLVAVSPEISIAVWPHYGRNCGRWHRRIDSRRLIIQFRGLYQRSVQHRGSSCDGLASTVVFVILVRVHELVPELRVPANNLMVERDLVVVGRPVSRCIPLSRLGLNGLAVCYVL